LIKIENNKKHLNKKPDKFKISPRFCEVIKSGLWYLLSISRIRPNTRRLFKIWKGVKPSKKDAVIIGGGPSFTDDLANSVLCNREMFDLFAINYYCENQHSDNMIPDYYVLSDPATFSSNDAHLQDKNANLKKYLIRHASINLVIPIQASESYYVNRARLKFDDRQSIGFNNIDPRYPRGYTSNTLFKALAVALKIGYKNIYIMGFDYNYPSKVYVDQNNEIFLLDQHHYGVTTYSLSDRYVSVAHAMYSWSKDYYYLKHLKRDGVFNVTDSSLVDVFDRMGVKRFISIYPVT
jgi:hypothetical protein